MHLQNFTQTEFRQWWPDMSPRLLVMLDVLRFRLGAPIYVSDNEASLGRNLGPDAQSEHNIDVWGEVLAVDAFVEGVHNESQAQVVVRTARQVGFTGIGVYTDTHNNNGVPQVMFHFGVRPTRRMGDPATWGRVSGEYVSIDESLKDLR